MNTFLLIPISYLNKKNISDYSFMANSAESKKLMSMIFSRFPTYKTKYMFRINNYFVIVLEYASSVFFDDSAVFECFTEYIHISKFDKYVIFNPSSNSIYIKPSCPKIIYNIINEFLTN